MTDQTSQIKRIMTIRNGMISDEDAEALVRREIERTSPETETLDIKAVRQACDDWCWNKSGPPIGYMLPQQAAYQAFGAGAQYGFDIANKSGHAPTADLETFIASNGALTREVLSLRTMLEDARGSLALADKMISEHIEKFHDSDYEPHQVPAELADLRQIEHHLMGSLILDEDIAAIVADTSTVRQMNEDEVWVEVTDGTTLPGDRFSYIPNPETGVGQITSHKRRVQSPDTSPVRTKD